MSVTAAQVKELRERTGLGMMECKKALVENDADIEKAIEALRKSGQAKAAKKSGRIAAEGIVCVKLAEDRKQAVMLEINCETDFVARDENFLGFSQILLKSAFDRSVSTVEELMDETLEKQREALIQKIGENITIRRLIRFAAKADSALNFYVHNNNRIAVLVELAGGNAELAKNIAMHIAAFNPLVIEAKDVPQDLIAKEREIYTAQAAESGKSAAIVEKMVEGRVAKFLQEVSLMDQAFVMNDEITVGKLLSQSSAKMLNFVRYEVGEGIQKEEVDFAAEVMAQAQAAK